MAKPGTCVSTRRVSAAEPATGNTQVAQKGRRRRHTASVPTTAREMASRFFLYNRPMYCALSSEIPAHASPGETASGADTSRDSQRYPGARQRSTSSLLGTKLMPPAQPRRAGTLRTHASQLLVHGFRCFVSFLRRSARREQYGRCSGVTTSRACVRGSCENSQQRILCPT